MPLQQTFTLGARKLKMVTIIEYIIIVSVLLFLSIMLINAKIGFGFVVGLIALILVIFGKRIGFKQKISEIKSEGKSNIVSDIFDIAGLNESIKNIYNDGIAPLQLSKEPILNRNLLNIIEWHSFELLCIKYFESFSNLTVKKTKSGADGGVDIVLIRNGIITYVQCKQRNRRKISVNEVRDFYGAMCADKVSSGVYVTTGSFTNDAISFCRGNGIKLIDGDELWVKLSKVSDVKKNEIESFLSSIDYQTPKCPNCEISLIKRKNKKTGREFWGCKKFPKCRYIMNI